MVFVAIVPDALPKVYFIVCVNEDDALVIVIVVADPIVTLLADIDDALGIESSVCVPLAVTLTA